MQAVRKLRYTRACVTCLRCSAFASNPAGNDRVSFAMLTGAQQPRPVAAGCPAASGRSLISAALHQTIAQHVGRSPSAAWRRTQGLAGRSFAASTATDAPEQSLSQRLPREKQSGGLVVVESPAKARKIQQYLGDGFTVCMAVRSMLRICMFSALV